MSPGYAPGRDLPRPKAPGGNGGLSALILCAGAAAGGYFLIQQVT